jgi:subtilisin family serine protease
VDILSAFPQSTYESNSGTSMAGPHVAGVVALMWSANADLIGDIDRTEEILIATARPYSGSPAERCGDTAATPNNATGYGVVDAYEATKRAVELR